MPRPWHGLATKSIMKKYLNLLFMALLFIMPLTLTSCEDDDPVVNDLLGSWKLDNGSLADTRNALFIRFEKKNKFTQVVTQNSVPTVTRGQWSLDKDQLTVKFDDNSGYVLKLVKVDQTMLILSEENGEGGSTTLQFAYIYDGVMDEFLK